MYDKKEMFQATCSDCGQDCEVPFRPTGGKPVLCSSCFGKQKERSGGHDRGRSGDRNFGRSGDRQMFSAVCDKCGKKAEVPFKPSGDKPIFCSDCFKKEDRHGDRRGGGNRDGGMIKQLSEQMKSLSNKVDKVINLLETGGNKKTLNEKETEKISATKKSVKKSAIKKIKKAGKKKK